VSFVLQFIRRYFISKLMNIIIAFYRFKAKYSYWQLHYESQITANSSVFQSEY